MNQKISKFIVLFFFCVIVSNTIELVQQNYLVIKNEKISALHFKQTDKKSEDFENLLWITNNQDAFKIQVPVLNIEESVSKYPILNYSNFFSLILNNLQKVGYVRPSTSHPGRWLKGYKFIKPKYNSDKKNEIIREIELFLQNNLLSNNLNLLNLRLEDSFEILFSLNNETKLNVNSIKIQYLFPTVQKSKAPERILTAATKNIYSQNQYFQTQSQGIIQRKLSGRGLHQQVNIKIKLEDKTAILIDSDKQFCLFEFEDILPQTTYVDSDQRRKQTTNFQVINIELPTFASKQYFYRYSIPFTELKQSGVRQYSYSQPINFRYPQPSLLNMTKVPLHSFENAKISCGLINNEDQKIYELKQNLIFERGVALIPNGDSSLAQIVPIVTLTICLITVLKITAVLKKK